MSRNFDEILDESVDRINHGERLEECVASYPEHAGELEPLLRAMFDTKTACAFKPSSEAKMASRRRFNAALNEIERKHEKRQSFVPRLFAWPAAWAAATTVVAVAVIAYFGINSGQSPIVPGPQPSPEGKFTFLISDEVNDNYAYFRFLGGVTDLQRRSRRARLLAELLEAHDFRVDVRGDLVVGRIKKLDAARMVGKMRTLGSLVSFTRQLDVKMVSDAEVESTKETFGRLAAGEVPERN